MNILFKCTQIHIDGTFKSSPKNFYQIINIAGFLPDINSIVPIFFIPVTAKSEFIYDKIFSDIKSILNDNGFNINDLPNKFMIDFEKALQRSIKKNFNKAVIDGCYFHYVKILWANSKKLGLCKYDILKNTKKLIFLLKLFPFLEYEKREDLFKKIEEYYNLSEYKYKNFLKYFKKNWLKNPYINYIELTNDEFLNRTNNYIESFHSKLNNMLCSYHPKLSYLIEKYKMYLINVYEKINVSLVNKVPQKMEKFSIINDIP